MHTRKVQSVGVVDTCDAGLASPLLPSGNVIIEGTLCSCYSSPWGLNMSHDTIHALTAPLRAGIVPLPPKATGGVFVYYDYLARSTSFFA